MGSKLVAMVLMMMMLMMVLMFGFASSNIDQDKAECADQLVALATCLPYVGGDAKVPTADCCTGLKQVLDKSKKCLCILIKDRNDPSLGLNINVTLAAILPSACHSPANISECVTLLHLAPNSPEAKVFQGFANLTQGYNASPPAIGNSSSGSSGADAKSDGGRGRRWLGLEMIFGVLVCLFFTLHLVFLI